MRINLEFQSYFMIYELLIRATVVQVTETYYNYTNEHEKQQKAYDSERRKVENNYPLRHKQQKNRFKTRLQSTNTYYSRPDRELQLKQPSQRRIWAFT